MIPTHLGDWNVQLKACLTLTGECKTGPIGVTRILNPCLDTNINAGYINYMMTAPILGNDSLNLNVEMGSLWPFTDTVDTTFPNFNYNCGQILYVILDSSKNPIPLPTIVTRTGDIITLTPRINDPIGDISLILRGYMNDYPGIFIDRDFVVRVTPCEATLTVSNLLNIPDKSVVWGDNALPYDIGSVFGAYIQTPACGYNLNYNILYEDVFGDPGLLITSNPPEIQYNPATTTFIIEKCSDAQRPFLSHYDAECLQVPFMKVFNIHFHVTLENEPRGAFNNQVNFGVVIGNVCEDDRVSFTSQVPSFIYTIRNSPVLFEDYPIIVHNESACPIFCQLKTAAGFDVPSNIGVNFVSPVF